MKISTSRQEQRSTGYIRIIASLVPQRQNKQREALWEVIKEDGGL
jgi:hypothetical protein